MNLVSATNNFVSFNDPYTTGEFIQFGDWNSTVFGFDWTKEYTFSIWFQKNGGYSATYLDDGLFEFFDSECRSLVAGIKNNFSFGVMNNPAGPSFDLINASKINNSEWTNAIIVFNNYKADIFINGENVSSGTLTTPVYSYCPNRQKIGDEYMFDANFFNGSIDEFRIYNTSLNSSTISEIYNSGLNKNTSIPETDLLAWFDFDSIDEQNRYKDSNSVYYAYYMNFTSKHSSAGGGTLPDYVLSPPKFFEVLIGGGTPKELLIAWNPSVYFELSQTYESLFIFEGLQDYTTTWFSFIGLLFRYTLRQPGSLIEGGGLPE